MKSRQFSHSFAPIVNNLKSDEDCSLKRHYRGALREVIGYLDLLANNDHERFVFAEIEAIVKGCKKYKSKTAYDERIVKYALAELRARHIISKRLTRTRHGCEMLGFIVAPHVCLAERSGKQCIFKGQLGAPGHCARGEGTPCNEHNAYRPDCANCKQGVVFWAGFADGQLQKHSAGQSMESALNCAPDCAPKSALKSALQNENKSPQPNEKESSYSAGAAPNLVNHSTLGTALTEHNETGAPGGAGCEGMGALGKSMNDETIGKHFGELWNTPDGKGKVYGIATSTFADITAESLNTSTKQWQEFDEAETLLQVCVDVLREFSGQLYERFATEARVMDMAMKRFTGKHGNVPSSWIKVMNDLRRNSENEQRE